MIEVLVDRNYDAAIESAFSSRRNGGPVRILDLGANVGYFSLRCIHFYIAGQERFPFQLFAVEGSPSLVPDLQRRLTAHTESDVQVRCGLVGHRSGEALIYSSAFYSCVNKIAKHGATASRNPLLNRRAEVSKYIDLDELVGPGPIDLIKCDIEGSELEFLQTYPDLLRRTKTLVIEFHPNACNANQGRRLLESYGLEYVHTIQDHHPTYSLEMFASRQVVHLAADEQPSGYLQTY
jgi:FkbM family methyltransferase